ncbi:putative Zn(II)2Cys6 transcription factor [Emericellopsis atlantica]|uniref:Zn(II)2Cys6 transcription factor n=1 Tax=Emericellopsis atlantica TaxID=2614577 RepID=A0A9P7ZES8_9HYPO|nr:putative Zn(II)2Cys6 transcription factor [Emericellopsis atlantica]KAG9250819.1 putative Zn(II)2Cys6 transcription factor [Emericellopsis atlantica]
MQRSTRKRSKAACQACHDRKVRCNLALSGPPCINCSLDNVACEPTIRKRHNRPYNGAEQRQTPASPSLATARSEPAADSLNRNETTNVGQPCKTGETHGLGEIAVDPRAGRLAARRTFRPLTAHLDHYRHSQEAEDEASPTETPIFGDPRGISLVSDICEPDKGENSGHLFVHTARTRSLPQDDLHYLRGKGVFQLPDAQTCDALIRAYFHHVHPFFPVVDPKPFLEICSAAGKDSLSIHLLWSMFLAASPFLPLGDIQNAGFKDRKEMKRSMYSKSKALYDAQYEADKITLIQSVLLMSFWYSDTEDRTGPPHWIGVAISLCQTSGLHRRPHVGINNDMIRRQQLWRQIWWACVYRDVWYSMGMGKPMRINLDDCDTEMPSANAVREAISEIPDATQKKYLPHGMDDLCSLWLGLLKLTVSLASILSTHYRVRRVADAPTAVQAAEAQVVACRLLSNRLGGSEDPLVWLHAQLFELYTECVLLVIYRPYLLNPRGQVTEDALDAWRMPLRRKAQAAATASNTVLMNIVTADMIDLCPNTLCMTLVPSMQIHLLNSTSPRRLVRQAGHHCLDFCLKVLRELSMTYFSAEVMLQVFLRAQQKVSRQRLDSNAAGTPVLNTPATLESSAADEPALSVGPEKDVNADPTSTVWYPFLTQDVYFGNDDFWIPFEGVLSDLPTPYGDQNDATDMPDAPLAVHQNRV